MLEPADAEEISRKIEESKFASDLVHRIRNSTRRLRLGAPKVDGRGIGLDPNTVAEYLDNTLVADQVSDLEKICLESDVHLAEVASCHQILALVLGEPIGVEGSLRSRIYSLGSGTPAGESAAALGMDGGPASAEQAEIAVPVLIRPADRTRRDYSGKRLPLRSLAITLACGFVLAVVALRAMGPFDQSHPLFRLFSHGETTVADSQSSPQGAVESTSGGESASPQEPVAGSVSGEATAPADKAAPDEKPTPPVAGEPVPGPVVPAEEPTGSQMPAEATPPGKVAAPPAVVSPPAVVAAPQEKPAPPAAGMPAGAEGAPPVPPAKPEARSVGRYISEEQVLARFDAETGAWFRLATDQPLGPGDRLLSLATYRPQVLISPNVKITFSGETNAQLHEASDASTATLQMSYGRAVVISADSASARIRLELPDRSGLAMLKGAESALTVEVTPFVSEGEDPTTAPRHVRVRLMPSTGQAVWQEATGEQPIQAGQVLSWVDREPAQVEAAGAIPAWVDGTDVTEIEMSASQELKRFLALDRPVNLSLLERAEFRREEVRALACRCLSGLDVFEPSLKALNDPAQRSYWQSHFETLCSAVQRQAETGTRLLADLQKLHSDEAASIFRLFWGYSQDQLDGGGAQQLVQQLENPLMLVRVLAISNLRRITDKTFLYRPEQPPAQEKSKILKWRKALEGGEIRIRPVSATPPPAVDRAESKAGPAPAAPPASRRRDSKAGAGPAPGSP
jgi:hypothetical protein